MTREEIYLAMHDHMVEVPHLGGSHVVYEFSPKELLNKIQSLLELERYRCADICKAIGEAWEIDEQAEKVEAANDLENIIRMLK